MIPTQVVHLPVNDFLDPLLAIFEVQQVSLCEDVFLILLLYLLLRIAIGRVLVVSTIVLLPLVVVHLGNHILPTRNVIMVQVVLRVLAGHQHVVATCIAAEVTVGVGHGDSGLKRGEGELLYLHWRR